jgi:hypothetical protein
MLQNTIISVIEASPSQLLAYLIYGTCTLVFVAWVIYLTRT